MAILWGGPYFGWILLGNDVDLARYEFPLVALLCVVAGLGLPANKNWGRFIIPATGLCLAFITIPQAIEHHTHPPIGDQLASYARVNSINAAYIVNDDTAPLIFFLTDEAPGSYSLRVTADALGKETAKLEATGRTVYLTALAGEPLPGADWSPVARFCRGQFMESRGPLEVWLYQHGNKVNTGNLPLDCEPSQFN
jgi:hypothetical protein